MPRTKRVGSNVLEEVHKMFPGKEVASVSCCNTRPGQIHTFEVSIDGKLYGVHHLTNLAYRKEEHHQAYSATFLVESSTKRQEGGKFFFVEVAGYQPKMVFLTQKELLGRLKGKDRAFLKFKL